MIRSKGNSGAKIMSAEFIAIWGRGYLRMTDAEFAEARSQGYTGPQQTLILMEIGEELTDAAAVSAQIARIAGVVTEHMDAGEAARATAKVLSLKVAGLKEQLSKFKVPFPKSGPTSLKPNLQLILTEHLTENAEHCSEFLADISLESAHVFLKGYCRNEHIVAQVLI